jgi:hypothetical protein
MRGVPGFRLILLTALAFPALIGCGHMPVTSMVRLARIDFQTTDPERLRVAVTLPRMLKARAAGTLLRITVKLANGVEEAREFALREVSEADAESGAQTFALAAADVARLHAFRAALIQKQKGGSGGALTIAVRPDACRTAPLPDGPVLFTSWLKTAETGGYVALARDVDLRTLDGGQDIAARIPAC